MREPVRDKGRLQHILSAIAKVEESTSGYSKEHWLEDTLHTHATAYKIQIIGEAVYNLSQEFKLQHPQTPWRTIEKMRHILVHDYFAVDVEIMWLVITEDIPVLKSQVQDYLAILG